MFYSQFFIFYFVFCEKIRLQKSNLLRTAGFSLFDDCCKEDLLRDALGAPGHSRTSRGNNSLETSEKALRFPPKRTLDALGAPGHSPTEVGDGVTGIGVTRSIVMLFLMIQQRQLYILLKEILCQFFYFIGRTDLKIYSSMYSSHLLHTGHSNLPFEMNHFSNGSFMKQ